MFFSSFLHPESFRFWFYNTLLCPAMLSYSSPLFGGPSSVLQATAPVSIPVCPELAGFGGDNGISVSWQSPPVIFKGASVSEAFSAESTTADLCTSVCKNISVRGTRVSSLCWLQLCIFSITFDWWTSTVCLSRGLWITSGQSASVKSASQQPAPTPVLARVTHY